MAVIDSFRERVEELVAQIPRGRVMTYGQLAALCGNARAARIVGGIAHFGSAYLHTNPDCPHAKHAAPLGFLVQDFVEPSGAHSPYTKYDSLRSSGSPRPATKCEGCGGIKIPWQRVVNKKGGLAAGYPGGRTGHKHDLEKEGVEVLGEDGNYYVNVEHLLWNPSTSYQLPSTISPLVVIVGETASGKSALALELAQKCNGEIIAADSRTIYRGMDIGTAKPSRADQNLVPHHMINVVSPDEMFNVGMFKEQANALISDISERGKLPILVGGTGLYVDSVIFDYSFSGGEKEKDTQNPRHLKKDESTVHTNHPIRQNTLVLGMQVEKSELNDRIAERVQQMIAAGFEQEVRKLSEQYSWDAPGMTAVGFKEWQGYFMGDQSLETTQELITTHTRQYAKRQRTWFKRNSHINWVTKQTDVHKLVKNFLQRL